MIKELGFHYESIGRMKYNISDKIKNALISDSAAKESLIHDIQGPYMDLDEDEGYLLSLKRTIKVMDENGKTYKVTIEEE